MSIGKRVYITAEEHEKCRRIMEAYAELYEEGDILVLDAGRYGFVKLQYYRRPSGFDNVVTYADSHALFDDLWEEWLNIQLLALVAGTPMQEWEYDEIFKWLPEEKQKELMDKRLCFAQKAGMPS